MDTIFITGYMACGKTTFGRALAKRLGRSFFDLDFFIEQRFRTTVSQLFNTRGEEAFRQIEANMLREAGQFEGAVIACGGGTPCFCGNAEWMKQNGTVVWLDTDPAVITARLIKCRDRRPLMASLPDDRIAAAVKEGIDARRLWYRQADIRFPGNKLESKKQIEQAVDTFINTFFAH